MDLGKERKKRGTFPQEDPIRRVIRIDAPDKIPVTLPEPKKVPLIREKEVVHASADAQSTTLGGK